MDCQDGPASDATPTASTPTGNSDAAADNAPPAITTELGDGAESSNELEGNLEGKDDGLPTTPAAIPPGNGKPTPREAARRLARFTEEVQQKKRSPL